MDRKEIIKINREETIDIIVKSMKIEPKITKVTLSPKGILIERVATITES